MRYTLFFGIVIACIIPFITNALTADEVKAQIQTLLTQIQQLQTQLAQIHGTQQSTSDNGVASRPDWCDRYNLLTQGQRGGEVTALQKEMGDDLGTTPTGYYGPLTRALWNKRCVPPSTTTPPVTTSPVIPTPCNGVNAPCTTTPPTTSGGETLSEPPGAYYLVNPWRPSSPSIYTTPVGGIPCNGVSVPCTTTPPTTSGTAACQMDAMRCSDGSYVGRSGPNCTFTCPTTPPVTTSSGCVTSSNGQTTCSTTASGSGSSSGSVGSGSTSMGCNAPLQQPSIACSIGVLTFVPIGGSTNGTCNGSWQCVQGL